MPCQVIWFVHVKWISYRDALKGFRSQYDKWNNCRKVIHFLIIACVCKFEDCGALFWGSVCGMETHPTMLILIWLHTSSIRAFRKCFVVCCLLCRVL